MCSLLKLTIDKIQEEVRVVVIQETIFQDKSSKFFIEDRLFLAENLQSMIDSLPKERIRLRKGNRKVLV